jgi:RNA polymerase sigma factor (sigma-70 family)
MGCCYTCAREGVPAAKDDLVRDLQPRIEKMAAYYSRCTGEDMEDLRQEAWFGLLEALRELDTTIGKPEAYLVQRARWRMLDAVKRARIRRCAPLDDSIPLADRSHECVLGSLSVAGFADQLKDNQRDVLTCLLGGMTWREAGARLGCTSANVAYHVGQIRKQYEAWSDS